MGEKKKEDGPSELHADSDLPLSVREGSAKGGGGEPVLVGERQKARGGEKWRGEKIERKDMTAGEEFEGVDEKNKGADVEEPEGGEGEAKSEAELEEGGAEESGDPARDIQRTQLEFDDTGKNKKAEKDRDRGRNEVSATTREKKSSAIETVGQGTKQNGVEHAFADFSGDLKIVIGGGADGFDDKQNGVVGEKAREGVAADSIFALEDGLPKNPRDEKRDGTKKSAEKIVPAISQLPLQADRKNSWQGAKSGGHERRRR